MMSSYFTQCIPDLSNLGKWLQTYLKTKDDADKPSHYTEFNRFIHHQHALNNWHREEDILEMLIHLTAWLNEDSLQNLINSKNIALKSRIPVLIKPNPHFPMAGIQEWIACMLTHTPFLLPSEPSQFQILKYLHQWMEQTNPALYTSLYIREPFKPEKYILYQIKDNETSLQYFSDKKALIIRTRPSIGIITGTESESELAGFGRDYFTFLGQSPRALRKIYLPGKYNPEKFLDAMMPFAHAYRNNKYANNYDYQQSILLMDRIPFQDTGFLVFRKKDIDDAPTGCLFYEFYDHPDEIRIRYQQPETYETSVCIKPVLTKTVAPGNLHFQALKHYFNQHNLIDFLLSPVIK